jgi:tetratricopeptide (TPR) repeat protein
MTTWRRTLLLAWAGSAALAAAGQEPPFGGEERVTAVDLLVRMDGGGLRPAELEALVSGVPRPVVAVEPPGDRGSWRVVLYFDAVLSDEHQMRWAAELLAGRLDEIRALGAVELVVADPDPRTVVSPEADGATLEEALAQMALFPRGEDALVERRLEFLEELEGIGPANLPAEAGAVILADESALVQEHLDALLLALVERSQGAPSRRLVLIASGGFDLAPGWLPPELAAPPSPLPGAVERLGRTLAAYGWLAAPLLAPPASGTVPGKRIGKWRIYGLGAVHEEDRDPELAAAYAELAEARRRQGELDGAADAARKALVHFADDPRTAERQARTLILLGEVYRELGEEQKARAVLRRAARRDPRALAGHPVLAALPAAPEAALGALAETTGSSLVRADRDLQGALDALDRWGTVTVQLPGLPDGELHEVEVRRAPGGVRLEGPGWLRFGTPRSVAEARSRSRGAFRTK